MSRLFPKALLIWLVTAAIMILGLLIGSRLIAGTCPRGIGWFYLLLLAMVFAALIGAAVARMIFGKGNLMISAEQGKHSAEYVQKASGGSFLYPVQDVVLAGPGGKIELPFRAFHQHITQVLSEAGNLSEDLNRLSNEILGQAVKLSESAEHESQIAEGMSGSLSRIDGGIRSTLENVDGLKNLAQDVSRFSREVMSHTEQVSRLSEELASFVREMATTITEIAGNIHAVATSTDSLSTSTSQSASSMAEISQTTQEIRNRADEATEVVEAAHEETVRTQALMDRSAEGMAKLEEAVGKANRIMEGLGEQSVAIGDILTVISDIASETHLLSLNASIMAARAGEHGLGFMVVANEIKGLAQRTSASTKEIKGLINRTREGISESIKAISEGNLRAREGLKASRDANQALRGVSKQVELAVKHFREIVRGTESQADMSQQVVRATADVEERTNLIKAAMREQEDSSRYLDQRAKKMRDLTEQVDQATKEQAESIQQITGSVESFLSAVGTISRATETQAQASSEIVIASQGVSRAADLVAISGETVSNTAMSVLHQSLLLEHEMKGFALPAMTPSLRIGLLLDKLREERWPREREAFITRAQNLGAEVLDRVADGDVDRQVSQAEDLLERGAGLLVVVASDSEKAARIVERAHERGVKVMAYDRMIRDCDLDLYITYDYQRVGEMQVRYMMKNSPVGRYLLLGGSPTDQTALWLREGQLKVLHPLKKAGIIQTIEDRWVQGWDPDVAYRQMKDVLKESKGNLDAVIASNDGTAGGCIRALIEAGLAGKIPVAGMDADLAACQRIAAGTQAMTIYMPIRLEAVRAAEVAVLKMKEEEIPGLDETINNGKIDVPVILLKPVRVDKDNLDEVIIKEGFHSREDIYLEGGNPLTRQSSQP